MSKPDLSSLFKLEFYRKQDNWRLASKPRFRGKARGSRKGDFNKTYVLSKSAANITTKLNDAFLETDPESAAENEYGEEEKTLNDTQIMSSFTELWSNPEEPEKEEKSNSQKPQNSESQTPESYPKIESSISPTLELPNIFLPDLHTDLWSEKVDFELNDCNDFVDPTPQSQTVDNNAKESLMNQNILVNLLKRHRFFINQLDSNLAVIDNGAVKEANENLPQGFDQKNYQPNEQEQFNKLDILSKLKQKILRAKLLNNNYLIPNANKQPIVENNGFENCFHNFENTIEEAKKGLSIHEKNFEIANQEQRNFERNFVESTLPATFQKDLENENTAQLFCNNMVNINYKNSVKPFNNTNNFNYVPTDFTDNSQTCYLNQNASSPQNQYIINNYKPIFFNQKFKPFYGNYQVVTKEYEAHLKNCQIISKNYYPEAVAKNINADAKNFQIDPKYFQLNANKFLNDANNCQNSVSNFRNGVNNIQNGANTFSNSESNVQNDASQFPNGANVYQNDASKFRYVANNFSNGANNIQNDENNNQNGANNFQICANNFANGANDFQDDANNIEFDSQSGNIVDHNYNTLPYTPKLHPNPKLLQHTQMPHNHQIFVRNPQIYYDAVIGAYPEEVADHVDPCFEWTENFKEQVLDDIDGIWNEGQAALNNATQWLNLVVDEDNLNPNVEKVCADIGDLNINTEESNLNTTSSTDSATFMRGAALAPHSSEISLITATGGCQRDQLASLVHKHASVLKSLLSRANSDNSLCLQTTPSLTQQKRHSATNTTPDQSCDYYPTRDVGSNTPLTDPTNPPASGDFETKLDKLRERLAQDQMRFENCKTEQKVYTVFSKFQHSKESPFKELKTKNVQLIEHNQLEQHFATDERNLQLSEHKCEPSERNLQGGELNIQSNEFKLQSIGDKLQSTERKMQQVDPNVQLIEHNVQSSEHNVQPSEHNVPSSEHNQQIEHKSGHHNMKTVNKLEMGSYKQTNNVGPYGRQKRSRRNSYLSNKKSHQINMCALD